MTDTLFYNKQRHPKAVPLLVFEYQLVAVWSSNLLLPVPCPLLRSMYQLVDDPVRGHAGDIPDKHHP